MAVSLRMHARRMNGVCPGFVHARLPLGSPACVRIHRKLAKAMDSGAGPSKDSTAKDASNSEQAQGDIQPALNPSLSPRNDNENIELNTISNTPPASAEATTTSSTITQDSPLSGLPLNTSHDSTNINISSSTVSPTDASAVQTTTTPSSETTPVTNTVTQKSSDTSIPTNTLPQSQSNTYTAASTSETTTMPVNTEAVTLSSPAPTMTNAGTSSNASTADAGSSSSSSYSNPPGDYASGGSGMVSSGGGGGGGGGNNAAVLTRRFPGVGYTFVLAGFLKIITLGAITTSAPNEMARTAFGEMSQYLLVPGGLVMCWIAKVIIDRGWNESKRFMAFVGIVLLFIYFGLHRVLYRYEGSTESIRRPRALMPGPMAEYRARMGDRPLVNTMAAEDSRVYQPVRPGDRTYDDVAYYEGRYPSQIRDEDFERRMASSLPADMGEDRPDRREERFLGRRMHTRRSRADDGGESSDFF